MADMKQMALRFPKDLYESMAEYAKASQTNFSAYCRNAVYQATFDRLQSDRSRLEMLREALEKLDLTDEQRVEQKKAIRELESRVKSFDELWSDMASILYGSTSEEEK